MSELSNKATRAPAKKRILNEIESKIINEEHSDRVTELRKDSKVSERADMQFGCECDTKNCAEIISMSTQEYAHVHQKNMHFIVVPSHVHLDIEEIITSFPNYCIVKKLFPAPAER